MRRLIIGLFLVMLCFSSLACQENPNAGANVPPPPPGSKRGGVLLPK
jgi:hypothetical protein